MQTMFSRTALLALALSLGGSCIGSGRAQAPSFVGHYSVQGRASAERQRDAAIETGVEGMFVGGNIARRRLAASTPIPSHIEVTEVGGRLHVDIAGAYDLTAVADGSPFTFEDAFGYEHTARLYQRANMLVITLRGHGDCRIELRFRPDRSSIRYVMRIRSEHLPGDVRYRATYGRN